MLKYICKILNKNTEYKSKKNPEIPDFFFCFKTLF